MKKMMLIYIAFLIVGGIFSGCGLVNPNHNGERSSANLENAAERTDIPVTPADEELFSNASADSATGRRESKRLPTLREYMRRLEQRQDTMQTDIAAIKGDVSSLRREMEVLKTAVLNQSNPTTGQPATSPSQSRSAKSATPQRREEARENESAQQSQQNDNPETMEELPKATSQAARSLKPDNVAAKPATTTPTAAVKPRPQAEKPAASAAKTASENAKTKAKTTTLKPDNTTPKRDSNSSPAAQNTKLQPDSKPVAQTPKSETPSTPKEAVVADDETVNTQDLSEDFRLGLEKFRAKQYNEAIRLLNLVVAGNENAVNKNNAYYWMGESHFNLKQYPQAIEAFAKVLATPGAAKADDAMILTAESYLKLGKTAEAKQFFSKLISSFPQSRYIARAKKMMQML